MRIYTATAIVNNNKIQQKNQNKASFGSANYFDGLKLFYNDMNNIPRIDEKTQNAYFQIIKKGKEYVQSGQEDLVKRGEALINAAAKKIVEGNLRLIAKATSCYPTNKLTAVDMINECIEGAIESTKRFDQEKGVKYSSYLAHWIKKGMYEAVTKKTNLIAVPPVIQKRKAILKELIEEGLSDSEIKKKTGWSDIIFKNIKAAVSNFNEGVSLDSPIKPESKFSFHDVISATELSPYKNLEVQEITSAIDDSVSKLGPQEQLFVDIVAGNEIKPKDFLRELGMEQNVARKFRTDIFQNLRHSLTKQKIFGDSYSVN